MLWIKRNLFLVIGGVISLALLGGAAFYLYNSFYDNDDQDAALEALKAELQQFGTGTYPSEENISQVKSNTAVAQVFMGEANRLLAVEPQRPLSPPAFSIELTKALDRLRRDATNSSVELPPKYEFTFGEIKARASVLPYTVEPLHAQLQDISTLCGVLYKAKVRAIESINRVPAYAADPGGADLLTDLAPRTNNVATNVNIVSTPYRLTFRGFVSELTAVLNGLAQTREFVVIRQMDLDAGGAAAPLSPGMGMDPMGMSPMPAMSPLGGLGGAPPGFGAPGGAVGLPGMANPAMAPNPAPAQPVRPVVQPRPGVGAGGPPPPKSSLTPILDEKPLRVTLVVDVIKARRTAPPAPGGK